MEPKKKPSRIAILGSVMMVTDMLDGVDCIEIDDQHLQLIRDFDGKEFSPVLTDEKLEVFCKQNMAKYQEFARGLFIGLRMPRDDLIMAMPFW